MYHGSHNPGQSTCQVRSTPFVISADCQDEPIGLIGAPGKQGHCFLAATPGVCKLKQTFLC